MSAPDHDPRDDYDDRPGGPPLVESRTRATTLPGRPNPWVRGVLLGLILGVAGMIVIPVFMQGGVRPAVHRTRSSNNLKQIGLAIHNYADVYGEFPNNTYGPDGRPLLSWRVHLLPFVEEDALYRMFKLDEPWDGPNNSRLLRDMPRIYARPMDTPPKLGIRTHYRGFSSPGAVFERRPGDVPSERVAIFGIPVRPAKRFDINSIRDGLSNTILVVEAWDPVEWTKPDNLDASPGQPFPRMGGFRWGKVFQALLGDGSVCRIPLDTPEDKLRALVTHSGGEPVTPD